ncbi:MULTISPECIES: lysine--tRNA ligase [unclassified Holdemanella]|uniref:lysine--tRNA ligase n=1 Tax=unclassified Holdemanella TaxID=2633909 RepID=UPI001D09BDC7|nr:MULTISPECIES: lysine--tRNA ligase [unclassified Holdemanella]MCB8640266.1 lysine--tRNA ligase [Holdemanella sp. DFI.5.55]MCG5648395.1 lysine--tRNA ligase [Holdemanella sp. DFI.5.21]
MEKLTQQEQVRRQKMQDLIDMGIDPFGSRYDRTSNSGIITSSYGDKTKEELDELQVTVKIAGRIMTKRRQGKAGFMNIQDREGQIQIYVRKDEIGDDQYEIFKKNDIGDIVGIEGTVMKTDHGQLSVRAKNYTHLSKSLRPLPEKFHGLTDVEERFRRRYVDLIMNPEAKRIALTRPKIIRAIQHYLDGQGLVEVETPVMQPILGGASARPFVTHHNTLNMDFYLRIATELPLKRLIVGGLEGVYEIGRLFRNEGMDAMHNPEFTTVEAYVAYSDLHGMMDLIEGLFDSVANEVLGTTDITYQGTKLSLKAPFKRIHMVDAIKEACGVDFWQDMSYEEALKLAEEHDIEVEKIQNTVGHIINLFFEKYVEETIVQPTFVYGHPTSISPLAKKNTKDPRFADRYELFICGHEYANAFSELNDPIDQRERFEKQLELRELGDDEANEVDTDYVEALEYGLPPTGGVGLGIDRFVMLLTDQRTIREVLLFPTMKSLDGVNKKNDVNNTASEAPEKNVKTESEKIDFSKVKVEPLFEEFVDFDTFSKSDFRAVKVKECVAVPKSKKLLQFTLDDGTGTDRTILSGIHAYYEPEELVGKTLIAITNLPPRAMMGIDSCGMLLSAIHEEEGEEKLHLLMVDDHIPAGAKLY